MFIVVWVDDLLTFFHPNDQKTVDEHWKKFSKRFDVKDMGMVSESICGH